MANDKTLQIFLLRVPVVTFDTQCFDTGLTFGAFFPSHLGALVSSYVNVLGRKNLHNFCQYVIDKSQHAVVPCTKHFFGHTPHSPHFVRTSGASQVRIRGQCRLHMSRQIDLGDHGNIAFGSIIHDFPGLLLRVKTAIRLTVIFTAIMPDHRFRATGTYCCQLRIFLYLDTPSLVVGNMPMQSVHVMQNHHIDKLLHLVHREKMAAHIEMYPPVTETRLGFYPDSCQHGNAVRLYRDCLAQRLYAIEYSCFTCPGNHYSAGRHIHTVPFRIFNTRI